MARFENGFYVYGTPPYEEEELSDEEIEAFEKREREKLTWEEFLNN